MPGNINIVEVIETSMANYISLGYGSIPTEARLPLTKAFKPFMLDILADLEKSTTVALAKSYYNEISLLFTALIPVFGNNLSITGDKTKLFYALVSDIVVTRVVKTDLPNKIYLFQKYFNITIDRLVAYNSTIDSGELLRIIEYYTYSDKKVKSAKFKYYSAEQTLNFKRFKTIFKTKVLKYLNELSSLAESINQGISDSGSEDIAHDVWEIPDEVLVYSWGGEGVKLARDLKGLRGSVSKLGGSEASVSGYIQFASELAKILNHICFGIVNSPYEYFFIDGQYYFGNFYGLYSAEPDRSRIFGLEFLEPFLNLRSFHTTTGLSDNFSNKIIQKFFNGIHANENVPLFIDKTEKTFEPYSGILQTSLVNLLKECNALGDLTSTMYNSLDVDGVLETLQGLGNMKYILGMLKEIFVTSHVSNTKGLGINGALEYFIRGLTDLMSNVQQSSLNDIFVEKLLPFLIEVQKNLDSLKSTIEATGVLKDSFVANIGFSATKKSRRDVISYLKQNNYTDEQIDNLTQATSVEKVLEMYGEQLTDSQDLKSFFKSYELAELIYAIGGESATYNFLDYLNAPTISNFRNLYEFLERNIDKYQYVDGYKYGKLVGTLLNINKLANFESFSSYAAIFKARNSTIFESVKFLDAIQTNPLLDSPDLITPFISQLPQGTHDYTRGDIGCEQALKTAPIALRQWVGLFDSAMGSANEKLLKGFLNGEYGITAKQLNTTFGMSDNRGISTLGGLLSGLEGGKLTKVLKHLYMSGVLLSLNAPDRNAILYRYEIKNDIFIKDFYTKLENISILISLVYNRLLLGFDNNNNSVNNRTVGLIKTTISKPLSASKLFFNFITKDSKLSITSYQSWLQPFTNELASIDIQLPPGIGSSQNDLKPLVNYLLPDQFLTKEQAPISQPVSTFNTSGMLSQSQQNRRFIRSDYMNEIAQSIPQKHGDVLTERFTSHHEAPEYSMFSEYLKDAPISNLTTTVMPNVLGGWSIKPPHAKSSYEKCRELTDDSAICSKYLDVIDISYEADGIPIQRDFYNLSQINPSRTQLMNSYKHPPSYYKILSNISGISELGEPLGTKTIKVLDPLNALHFDYAHTYHSLVAFRNTLRFRIKSIKDCTTFENNTGDYIKCVNHFRCFKNKLAYNFCNT